MSASPPAALGYFFGIDTYQLEATAIALGERVAGVGGEPLGRWRVKGATTTVEAIAERIATGSMFGGGTLAIVLEPAPLLRAKASRDALLGIVGLVAPGNALAFVEPLEAMPTERRPLDAGRSALREAVAAAGGEVRAIPALTQGGLTRFIHDRAGAIGLRLGRGAAEELAKRIGGFVGQGDADLSGLGQLAAGELDKAAIYKLDGELSVEDVRAIVPEVIPSSLWALTDAVGMRRLDAAAHLERALEVTAEPVIVVLLHRRIRELLELADRIAQGTSLVIAARAMKLHEFRARTLETQARRWSPAELEAALGGLLELDATVKGAGAGGSGEHARQLGFTLWLTEFVVRG
jgi:DNA polymerase III delta subunit